MSLVEETREELNHVHQMLHVLRNRLRERQVQAARYGYDVPPQVATEIKDLERDIKFYEDKRELLDRVILEHSMRPKQSKKKSATLNFPMLGIIAGIFILLGIIVLISIVVLPFINRGGGNDANPNPSARSTNPTSSVTLISSIVTPESFINDYYDEINRRQYDVAFSMLSDSFKKVSHCCKSDGSYDDSDYVSYWNTIQSVSVRSIERNAVTEDTAILTLVLDYQRMDGIRVEQMLKVYIARQPQSDNEWAIEQLETIYNR